MEGVNLEYVLTHYYKEDMIAYLKSNPESFNEAIELAITNKQPFSKRAAWLLWSCMDENDKRIQENVEDIINILPTENDSQNRDLLIILQNMQLEDDLLGKLFNICINIWKNIALKPSVRYNAFKMMIKIAEKLPELIVEIKFLSDDYFTVTMSNSVKKSIAKMLESID